MFQKNLFSLKTASFKISFIDFPIVNWVGMDIGKVKFAESYKFYFRLQLTSNFWKL